MRKNRCEETEKRERGKGEENEKECDSYDGKNRAFRGVGLKFMFQFVGFSFSFLGCFEDPRKSCSLKRDNLQKRKN